MIKIGAVTLDTSHPLAFGQYLEKGNRGRYVAVYNEGFRGDDQVEAFMKMFDVGTRCRSLEEMAGLVDIAFIHGCNWDQHIEMAMPFIEAGKPVFIDKPIVGNIRDCARLEELVSGGAMILGSSSLRYCQEVMEFLARPESDTGAIMNLFGTCGVDEFNYGCHIVECLAPLAGAPSQSAKFVGRSEKDGKICETFFVQYQNGVTATYTTFQGTWQPCEVVITTNTGTHRFRVNISRLYGALIERILDTVETGKNYLASIEELTDAIRIMLAARISREQGGGEVSIEDIPEDDPGYDGQAFYDEYAAKSPAMYLVAFKEWQESR
jgi:predicted dehydrogenase